MKKPASKASSREYNCRLDSISINQMIIEFIGAPGSGKTTLLPTVIEVLNERGICARTVVEAARPYALRTLPGQAASRLAPASLRRAFLWQVFYHLSTLSRINFFLKHPRLIWQVFATQKRRPAGAGLRQRRVLYWFFHMAGYYEFLKAHVRPNEALIFDEGFIHRVVQLNASPVEEPQPNQIMSYIDLLPQPDLVVFTQAPATVCEKRIYNRGIWDHFSERSSAEVARFVANANQIVNLAVEHVKAKGWTVIEIDNGDNTPNASQAELRHKLRQLKFYTDQAPGLPQ